MTNDYYETLGVARSASEKEIRSAYRRLARQRHPDVNQGDERAEAEFKKINEAYRTLSDPDSRKKYDRFGANWRHAEQFQTDPRANAGAPPFTFFRSAQGGAGGPRVVEFDVGEFGGDFEDFWSGARGAGRRRGRQPAPDAPAAVTLEEAYAGTTRVAQSPGGKRLEVRIPPGVKSGERVRVNAEGGAFALLVTVAPHPDFERDGDDIRFSARVPMLDAVLGGEAAVPTLDGKRVAVTIPPGTQNGRVIRLRGKGMPKRGGGYGDLLVAVTAVLPTELSGEQRALFERLRDAERGAAAPA